MSTGNSTRTVDDVAITGIALRFPGTETLDGLFEHLLAGRSLISEVPSERWSKERYFGDPRHGEDKTSSIWGGFIEEADRFDAAFFNISPREAESMDPQQRFALELAWKAIEDAGYRASDLAGSKTGVFMGVCHMDYAELMEREGAKTDAYFPTGTAYSIIANRVSYLFDLQGPSITNDTACSSSLVSVYEAVSAIQNGECGLALAGGVNLCWSPKHFVAFSKASMLSRTGQGRAFDQEADGYVRGEGGAVLLLKPLSQAVEDGDPIYAVIKGVATNHGGKTSSLTVTNPAAQTQLIEGLYTRANIAPESVSYIEAHGPGTPVGDPIEVVALKRAFQNLHTAQGTEARPDSVGIGSIKTNIGHLEGAAGVAGMIKVIGSLAGRSLPATVGFEVQNRLIRLEDSPFFIVRDTQPWDAPEAFPRRAGVSSFGFGGTNAHVVLEEYVPDESLEPAESLESADGIDGSDGAGQTRPQVVPLSAKTPAQLSEVARELAEYLRASESDDSAVAALRPREALADIAYTLRVGRESMAARIAFVVGNRAELLAALESFVSGELAASQVHVSADDASDEIAGIRSTAQQWVEGGAPDWATPHDNDVIAHGRRVRLPTYPFARERYWFVVPEPDEAAVADQSLLHPVVHRNTSDLTEQRYSSTFTGEEPFLASHQVRGARILPAVVYLEMARAAVQNAVGRTAAEGSFLRLRDVAWMRPFIAGDAPAEVHVGLVPDEESVRFEVYAGPEAQDPSTVVHSQGTVEVCAPDEAQPQTLDVDALRARCATARAASEVYAAFQAQGLEYGPDMRGIGELFLGDGEVLARIEPSEASGFVLPPSVMDAAFQASVVLTGESKGASFTGPTLPFAVESLEVLSPCVEETWAWVRRSEDSGTLDKFDIDLCGADGVVHVRLRGLVQRTNAVKADTEPGVVTGTSRWVDAPLATRDPANPPTVHGFTAGEPGTDLTVLPPVTPAKVADGAGEVLELLFARVQDLVKSQPKSAQRFVVLVDDRVPRHFHAPLTGLLQTVALENPLVSGRVVRVANLDAAPAERTAKILRDEAADEQDESEVRYAADGTRQAWRTVDLDLAEGPQIPALKNGGVYWITGGLGGLGRHFARYFARYEGTRIVLSGRSEAGSASEAALEALRDAGVDAHYVAADVTDKDDVRRVAADIVREHGSLDGIVHAAGVLHDEYVLHKDIGDLAAVLEPKVRGTVNLDAASRDLELDFFVVFSSVAGVYGNAGQADYAAANAFLDAFAFHRQALVDAGERTGRTVALSWPLWADGGMTVDDVTRESMRRRRGWEPLPTEPGLRVLGKVLDGAPAHVVVAYGAKAVVADELRVQASESESSGARPIDEDELVEGTTALLKRLLGEVLHRDPDTIEAPVNLVEYGIDSLTILDMTMRLEELFGPLSKTLFFEYTNIEGVTEYFVEAHRDKLEAILGVDKESEDAEAGTAEGSAQTAAAVEPAQKVTTRARFARTTVEEPRGAAAGQGSRRDDYHDVAVIGISGKYPGADTMDELWAVLEEGRHEFKEVPRERWDYDAIYSRDRSVPGKTSIRTGTFVDGIDKFDPRYFRVSKRAAEQMSPEVRFFLQAGVEALEDAGYSRETIQRQYEGDVGVLAGTMSNHYNLYGYQNNLKRGAPASGSYTATMPNMLSYFYGLTGPSIFLDTMCSAAATCIHQGVQMLRSGETKMVVAGGVNLLLHPYNFITSSQEHFTTATSDVIRSFGVGADGTILGEGVGAVILKPLVEAEADGDHIYGVIKGTAITNAGVRNGFTVPNPRMQARAVEKAIDDAGVNPRTISYVEAHGSGTSLGDPIEVKGLTTAYRKYTADNGYCAIGSVKSNMGHLLAAAGMIGFAKVMLQLQKGTLAPSLHSAEQNPDIAFSETPFQVQRELTAWEPATTTEDGRTVVHPRRAGITSIGAGGMNSHIIVEEYTAPDSREPGDGRDELFVFSAMSDGALETYLARFREFLSGAADADLPSIAFTSRVGKNELPRRWAFLAKDVRGAVQAIERYLAGDRELQTALASDDARASVARELATSWVGGKSVDWDRLVGARPPRRVSLPAYPFEQVRCWVPEEPDAPTVLEPLALREKLHPLIGRNESDVAGLRYGLDVHFDDLLDYGYQRDESPAVVPTFAVDLALASAKVTGFAAEPLVRGLRVLSPIAWESTSRLVTTFTATSGQAALGSVFAEDGSGVRTPVMEFDVLPGDGRTCPEDGGVPASADALRRDAERAVDKAGALAELAEGGLGYEPMTSGLEAAYGLRDGRIVLVVTEPELRRDHARRNVTVPAHVLAVIAQAVQLEAKWRGAPDWARTAPQLIDEIRVFGDTADVTHVVFEPALARVRLVSRDGAVAAELVGVRFDESPHQSGNQAAAKRHEPSIPVTWTIPPPREPVAVRSADDGLASFVVGELRGMAAGILKFEVEELDVHTGFDAFGFDSISLVALGKLVRERFSIELSPAVFFDTSTFDALGTYLVSEFGEAVRAVHAKSAPAAQDTTGEAAPAVSAALRETAPASVSAPVRETDGKRASVDAAELGNTPAEGPMPIAVIGAAGRFPGAGDLDEYWANLVAGKDSVTEFPKHRYDEGYARIVAESDFPQRAGVIDDVDQFDAGFFHILPREAELMDPQHRLTLETVWSALEDSAYTPADLPRDTGLFFGVSGTDYATLLTTYGVPPDAFTSTGNAHSMLVNRVSYLLDVRGPSEPVDTACSSSLVAVHRAIGAIRAGSCEMAIAGGVNLLLSVDTFVSAQRAGMLSPDGLCKTFAADADGYVRGEGVGAVILKPLAAAERDGDAILGVLRGSAENHGGRANSLTAPNADAQAELVTAAVGELDPDTIGYIEAHGTGTALGDPVEVRGLQSAFKRLGGSDRGVCGLGSVKTNIGHLEASAGIAGLLKVLLAMKHGVLPATLHSAETNPYIELDGGPFHIVRENEPWRQARGRDGTLAPRRAGVSSFGFGGANCHVVVEEHVPAQPDRAQAHPAGVAVPLSARTADRLREIARNLLAHIEETTDPLDAVAWSLQAGREALDERVGWVVASREELAAKLRAFVADGRLEGGVRGSVARRRGGLAVRVPEGRLADELREAGANGDAARVLARWTEGVVVDWSALYGAGSPRRVHLPTYPFARERFWIPSGDAEPTVDLRSPEPGIENEPENEPEIGTALLTSQWTPKAVSTGVAGGNARRVVILCGDLAAVRGEVERDVPGVRCFPVTTAKQRIDSRFAEVSRQVFEIIRDLADEASDGTTLVQVVTPAGANEAVNLALAALLRTARLESARVVGQVVGFDGAATGDDVARALAENAAGEDDVVLYRNGVRMVREWACAADEGTGVPWRDNGVYLITGGANGIGAITARRIARDVVSPTLVLVGRSPRDERVDALLGELRAAGALARYDVADISRWEETRYLLGRLRDEVGEIHGVIHSAGVIRDATLGNKTAEQWDEVLGSKADGLANLDRATERTPLEFLLAFSSGAAVTGNPGQADYATANAFLDEFATLRNARVAAGERSGRTLSIAWPLWKDGGMAVDDAARMHLWQSRGLVPMDSADGLTALARAWQLGAERVWVHHGDTSRVPTAAGKPVAATARPATARPVTGASGRLVRETLRRLVELFGDVTKLRTAAVDPDEPLGAIGLDSIMVVQLNKELTGAFEGLSKTLFYEFPTLRAVAGHLAAEHSEQAAAWTGEPATAGPAPVATPAVRRSASVRPQAPEPGGAPDAHEPIAIIGLSGRYPNAENVGQFWENLKEGRDGIREVPADRWSLDGFFEPDQKTASATGRSYSKWGGFLDDFATFDPLFFQIAPRDAYAMDPQERLFLQASWEVLEDAGYTREELANRHSRRVGVFAGVTKSGHARHETRRLPSGEPVVPGLSFASVSSRTSYFLDLRGPSMTIDTMCSASLTAIHEACEHLRRGSCEAAIAGGVNLYTHPLDYIELCRSQMLSADERCRSFGSGGHGFVPGEGVGCVLLKPLSRAVADGDRISAVIRGTSVNHGGSANGYTVPNPNAQAELIREALDRAGVSARDISYVEAHGTGTELGDPIEIKGLTTAFAQDTDETGFCAIGSAKSAIGHLEAAAGVAGLTKLVLQLRHQQIAPSLHAEQLNPNIAFERTPFFVQRELTPWDSAGSRIGSVSSFGAGGSNAHVILEEYVEESTSADDGSEQLVVLSARTPEQLHRTVSGLEVFLDREDVALADLAFTLQVGREAMKERLAVVVSSTSELRRVLRSFLDDGAESFGVHRGTAGRAEGALAEIAADDDLQDYLIARWAKAGKLAKLAALWADGVRLDWHALHGQTAPRRIALPTYPFARDRYWIEDLEPMPERRPAAASQSVPPAGAGMAGGRPRGLDSPSAAVAPSAPVPPPVVDRAPASTPEPRPAVPAISPREHVAHVVREKLAAALAMRQDEIDGAHAFADYGLDSILGVRLVHELNDALALDLSTTVIFDHSSADRLVTHLLDEHGDTITVPQTAPAERESAPAERESARSAVEPPSTGERNGVDAVTSSGNGPSPSAGRSPIAIVGMSGKFAGSNSLDELWTHLAAGDDLVTEASRWDLRGTDGDAENRCTSGGFIDRIDEFDPLFFNISGVEAGIMDPQQRLLLEESWKALEDAGYAGKQMSESRCGVYVGCWEGDYQNLIGDSPPAQAFWGNLASFIPGRVSYCLNLKGPAIAVDTSCSSSLVAIDQACKDLWSGETTMALAGGVFLQTSERLYDLAGRAGMLSPTGHCHTFDHRADGFVPGEGVGVVVLKRLADALEDGDHIHGVVRGTGINHDGATNGITAPSSLSQESLLREVYETFDVDVEKIQMVEAHGTGTSLGDPIEFQALSRAFRKGTDQSGYCAVGSVKTNLGHTQYAAGVAGVFKILLGMKHEQIPASLHFEEPNKAIPIDGSPFYMSTRTHKWEAPLDGPRCGVVSSFGASGTNAHLVLEEAPAAHRVRVPSPAYLVVLSARTREQLAEQVTRLAAYCHREPSVDCGDLAYTLTVGREHFEHRFACVARDVRELVGILDEGLGSTRAFTGRKSAPANSSEAVRLGEECLSRCHHGASESALRADLGTLAESYVRGVVIDYAQAFPEGAHLRVPLPTYPFARERHWPEQRTPAPRASVTTLAARPAPAAVSAESRRPTPGTASQAPAPAPTPASAPAQPGVLRDRTTLTGTEPYVRDHKVHGRRVLPGVAYLEMAREIATRALGVDSTTPLVMRNVTWVQPLVVESDPVNAEVVTKPLRSGGISFEVAAQAAERVVFCEGRIARSDSAPPARVDLAALRKNCPTPVSADHIREALGAMGIEHGPALRAIDTAHVGAGVVLAKLDAPAIDRPHAVLDPAMLDSAVQASMALQLADGAASQETAVPFALDSLEFFGECTDSMWAVVRTQDTAKAGPLSTLDIDLVDVDGSVRVRMTGYTSRRSQEPTPAMFEPVWDAIPSEELGSPVPSRNDRVLVVGGTARQREAIARDCPAAMGWNLPPTASIDAVTASLSAIEAIDHLVWIAPDEPLRPTDARGFVAAQENGVIAAFRMVKSLLRARYDTRALGITLITQRGITTHRGEETQPTHAGLHGLLGALGREYENWSVRRVDLESAEWPADLAVLPAQARDDIWVQRSGQWLRRRLAPTEMGGAPVATYRDGGVYVVIGGAGGLGVAWTRHVVEHYGATVVWIGRRERDESIDAKLDGISGEVHYIAADATEPESLRRAHAEITARYGHVNGVIQAALVLRDQSLARMNEEVFRASLSAKVDASVAMAQVFADEPLDFVLFFSSLQSFATAAGQSNYAAGCTFADSYANYLAQHWTCPVKVMNWGWWGSIGSVSSEFFTRRMREWGLDSIEAPEGMAALDELLAGPQPQLSFVKTTRSDALDMVDLGTRTAVYGRARDHVAPSAVRSHDALRDGAVLDAIAAWRADERDPLLVKMIRAHLEALGIAPGAEHADVATVRERCGILELYTTWLEHALRVMPESAPPLDVVTREWKQRCAEWSQDSDKAAELRLVDATLAKLPEILTGRTRPTDVMFPRGSVELVEGCYRNNRIADAFNRAMSDAALSVVSERVRQNPDARLRILEIGAGTGGTSVGMFATLRPYQDNIETYTYTDLSKAFLNHARSEYGPDVPYLECQLFNAEKPLAGQGIEPGSYDLVIAANVLHATRDTRNTLRNAKAAMRDGGWLLLNELAVFDVFAHLTFGLLEGWWLFEDPTLRVPGSPALSPEGWRNVLESEGFPSVVFVLPKALQLGQQIIAAESDGIARQQLTSGETPPAAGPRSAVVGAGAASGPVASRATEPKPAAATPTAPTPIAPTSIAPSPIVPTSIAPGTGPVAPVRPVPASAPRPISSTATGPVPAAEVAAPLPEPGAVELLAEYVREKAAGVLKVPADRIDSSAPLADYGLDSILVLQLANALREELDEVSPALLFDVESVDGLAGHLLESGGSEVNVLIGRLRPVQPEIPQGGAGTSVPSRESDLSALILDKAAAVLRIPADRIDTSAPLTDYGLDSILVLQLTNALREDFGDDISSTLLFDVESIDGLSAHFAGTEGERWNLSRGQLTMYRDQRRWPELTAYNLPLLFEVHGDLDEAALERAIRAQTEIHPVLSALFGERDGVPYMDIDPSRAPSLSRVDIAATSRAAQLAELRELVNEPFDLATGPLVRTHLVSLAGQRRLLMITAHHILLDGTSTAVLIRTLKEAYQGKGSLSRATYGDFVAWEEAMLAGSQAQRHRDYWVRELEGPRTTLALPYDRPHDPRRMPRVEVAMMKLPPRLVTALTDTAREHRVSVATVLFTTYVRFLHRLTGQDDLILGMTAAARYEEKFRDVVGQFANCLPIRCAVTGGFPELLKSMQRKVLTGIEHGAYPLREITRALGAGDEPLVLTNFLFQNFDGAELLTNGSSAGHGELDLRVFDDLPYTGEYVLSAEFYREGEGYKVFLKYDANAFDEATAHRMMDEWYSVIQSDMDM